MLLLITLLFVVLPKFISSECTELFDASQPVTAAQFECLTSKNHTLFYARVGTSDGRADEVGIQNIINAGWNWTGWMYMDPCTDSTKCPSPAEHIMRINQSLIAAQSRENYTNYVLYPDAFFINVQGQWSSDRATNQRILTEYTTAATRAFEGTIFMTDYISWSTNFGPQWTVPSSTNDSLSVKYIWWRKYDGRTDTSGFTPFSNFTSVLLKQYASQVNVCGVQINLDVGFCVFTKTENCDCGYFTNG